MTTKYWHEIFLCFVSSNRCMLILVFGRLRAAFAWRAGLTSECRIVLGYMAGPPSLSVLLKYTVLIRFFECDKYWHSNQLPLNVTLFRYACTTVCCFSPFSLPPDTGISIISFVIVRIFWADWNEILTPIYLAGFVCFVCHLLQIWLDLSLHVGVYLCRFAYCFFVFGGKYSPPTARFVSFLKYLCDSFWFYN